MSERDDGGPAFPAVHEKMTPSLVKSITAGGMSLRDYFAAKAMHALLSTNSDATAHYGKLGEWSYSAADAMLKARQA